MLDWLLLACALGVLIVGTWSDIRTREVPDWISFAGVAAGLGLRIIWALAVWEWQPLTDGILGFGVGLIIAYAMFYLGQWGGGDSKMLMALGALFGLRLEPSHIAVAFAVNLLFFGGIYGLGWTSYLALLHRRTMKKPLFAALRAAHRQPHIILILAGSAFLLLMAFIVDWLRTPLLFMALMSPALYYLSIIIKVVETTCMQRAVPPSALTEGDWVVRDIVVGKKRICGPNDLGLSMAQIRTLRALAAKKKVRTVLIKVGLPFIPVFLVAFLLALWWGNPLLLFFG